MCRWHVTMCCVALQVTFSAPAPATFGEGGTLELWYTISVAENDNPVTIGGDTVALDAVKYEKPFTVSLDVLCKPLPAGGQHSEWGLVDHRL